MARTQLVALGAVVAGTALLGSAAASIGGAGGGNLQAAAPAPQVRSLNVDYRLDGDGRRADCPHERGDGQERGHRGLRADEL